MDAEEARRTLTEERRRLVDLGDWNRDQQPQPAAEQEGALGQHSGDDGAEVGEFMDAEAMDGLTRRQVTEIDQALARIDDGSWGRCAVCGREIDAERLEAKPQAERCREHQEEFERSSR